MNESCRGSFPHREALLTTWLAGANLLEVARSIELAKAELARRGISLAWSITQGEEGSKGDSETPRLKPNELLGS